MKQLLQNQRLNAVYKAKPLYVTLWTKVIVLFFVLGAWRVGMGQSVFMPGGAPIVPLPQSPVGINIPPAPGIDFHVNGNIRFQGLPNIALANSFLAMDVVGNIFHQTGSLPLMGSALGQSLYWSGTHWQPTSFLNVNPVANFVGVGTAFPALNRNFTAAGGTGPATPAPNVVFAANGSAEFNGDVTCIGNFYLTSDENFKMNFKSLNTDWRKLLILQPYSYDFKRVEGLNLSATHSFGFKAQDVKKVFPSLVSEGDSCLSVNYIGFIPVLTQGVQEHDTKIQALQIENTNLKIENQTMNNRLETLENEKVQLEKRLIALESFIFGKQENSKPFTDNTFDPIGVLNRPALLEQNEPNPFSEETVIHYFLPYASNNAKIEIKDTEGRIVGLFRVTQVGYGNITISAGTLSAGNYFYSLIIDNKIIENKKMVLSK
ncbi:MAG: tail fiber domain-containing protein [Bacteroidia bacterium]|nr:tail fiber domain-containing protein [Bacteroidia bacterium]MCO5254083.1 tail fiber domain-containing protein [Bacteroidota bacterium]